ncbi:UNVERIFIED_CONTAM: hypothetical protein Sradi_6310300 [Sesamum radiatum]|uniref:Uncharacterized protein n=1 Tax=Sesamum radiatum TaxID=300843 RepID=A0AAW2KD78_SESRA
MLTPPLHPSVSIPFHWEEVPGKPRATADEAEAPPSSAAATSKNKAARCLDLPPRLLHDDASKSTITPSPLDGPYVGRSLSLACTFSFRKEPVPTGREEGAPRPMKRSSGRIFGCRQWGSFKDQEKLPRGSFDLSHSLGWRFVQILSRSLRGSIGGNNSQGAERRG